MHKSIRVHWLFAVAAGVLALCAPAFGEEPAASGPRGPSAEQWQEFSPQERDARREEMRQRMENMSPEQREALKQRLREKAANMPPEERAAKREAMRERWERMTPEQREAVKKKVQERRNKTASQN